MSTLRSAHAPSMPTITRVKQFLLFTVGSGVAGLLGESAERGCSANEVASGARTFICGGKCRASRRSEIGSLVVFVLMVVRTLTAVVVTMAARCPFRLSVSTTESVATDLTED